MKPIKELITMMRESFGGADIVYTHGSCYRFAKILQTIYGGELVDVGGHICLKYGGKIWDIKGEVDTKSYVGQEHVSPFYQNQFQRFDLVIDADLLPTGWGLDQLNTLVAREMQMLRFGHDLDTVANLIKDRWQGDTLHIVESVDNFDPTVYSIVVQIQHEDRAFFLCVDHPTPEFAGDTHSAADFWTFDKD